MGGRGICHGCNNYEVNCLCGIPAVKPLESKQIGGSHYQTGEHECFDVIAEWHTSWPKACVFPIGSCLKYLARLGRKSHDTDGMRQDLDKAISYLVEARRRLG